MAKMKLKKDDLVRVITGKDKGKEGKIIAVDRDKNKVVVEGVNIVKRHTKPSGVNQQGGIIEKEAPLDASKVMYLYNGKPARIQYQFKDGKKVRAAKVKGAEAVIID